MSEYITDTHSLLWYIFESPRLSKKAASLFKETDAGKMRIYIPGIVLVEIVYLMEKSKIPQEAINHVMNLLDLPTTNYRLTQITTATVRALQSLPRQSIPDMPDRIIAATALELDLPLITRDEKITAANVKVIW